MQQPLEKKQPFEIYFDNTYNYTPYVYEIAVILQEPIQTLILCNLLNKLYSFNKERKIYKKYGKEYHFTYEQKAIYENELGIKKTRFVDNLKLLSKYVWFDGNVKNNREGYNTTYFKLNLEAIKDLFNEGRKMLGKDIKTSNNENKPPNKPHQQNKYSTAKGINKKLPELIIKSINTINDIYTKFLNNELSEKEYKNKINPIKGLIEQNKFKIIENKELKKWEIV